MISYTRNKRGREVIKQIITEAFLAGHNIKSIAGYFGYKNVCSVYEKVDIKQLKKMQKELEGKGDNS